MRLMREPLGQTSAFGPTLPTLALQQVGSYLGYTVMAVLRLTLAPSQHHSPVGQEYGRTTPSPDEPNAPRSC